jgi:ribose transport system permease protein
MPASSSVVEPAASPPAAGSEEREARRSARAALLRQLSFPLLFLAVIILFSIARPETFPTWDNARAIFDQASVLMIMTAGLIGVLLIGEFDLSVGAIPGAAAAAAVTLMVYRGAPTGAAVAVGLLVGVGVGFANGIAVAVLRIPAFIATLAIGSLAGGLELAIAETTIFEGLSKSYVGIGRNNIAGIPVPVYIAVVFAVVLGSVLRFTVFGRQSAAIGDNATAAHIAGVPTTRVRIIAFTVAGFAAAIAGIILSARAGSYYPGAGPGLLLSAYAAAFLGLSLGGGWRFNVLGGCLGVLFLGTVTTGLNMLDQPAWMTLVVQGSVLLVAVLALSRKRGIAR